MLKDLFLFFKNACFQAVESFWETGKVFDISKFVKTIDLATNFGTILDVDQVTKVQLFLKLLSFKVIKNFWQIGGSFIF